MKKQTHIMLVEDNPGYREVIELAIECSENLELISQFGTAEIALRSIENSISQKVPDIILLDISLPGMSGIEAIPWIRKYLPKSAIIMLTQSNSESDVLSAISRGALGYLLKSATVDQIKEAIQTVVDGGASLDPNVALFILEKVKAPQGKNKLEKTLSDRELEVLTLLSEGLAKKEIAHKLNIGFTTVAYHVKHIYEKLNVQNAPAAVSKAYRSGILSVND